LFGGKKKIEAENLFFSAAACEKVREDLILIESK
jgi:hypothetical protein